MDEQHLAPLSADEDSRFDGYSSSDDASVEVTSTIDECENELVRLSTYLQLESEFDNDDDRAFEWPEPPPTLLSSRSSDIEELADSQQVVLSTTSFNNGDAQEKSKKCKRCQWSILEKLDAIALFDKNQSKRGKRKRLEGGDKKVVYADLDSRLFTWYRSRRTDPNDQSQLNHSSPVSSWYLRFLRRNGLSLQRPKRQDKVPLDEVDRLANSFYMFNRRASSWSIRRGRMGAFISEDICNMDESPLALFGDQAKRSVNDIGTSDKRKRLEGGGKKVVYADLDSRLFTWCRLRRTDPNDQSRAAPDIQRERITLRHLEKEGRRIAKELNHSSPVSNWYLRVLKRNGLLLQRPKRQDKVPLDEVHRLANSFYMFNRRASSWSIRHGPMGAFISEDICNMNESPLALFGDQAKRSVNDIGTSNEINGYISNKVDIM
ncbi:unnamed protein product [Rotaria sp. Silwood2]|nr:unnamed protein product [Rotaria sp. Silwood2]